MKRGFTSERAAKDAKRRLVEQVERRELVHTAETFGAYWARWLQRRRPYLEPGTWGAYEIDGRKRLLPAFADVRLGSSPFAKRLAGRGVWHDERTHRLAYTLGLDVLILVRDQLPDTEQPVELSRPTGRPD